MEYLRLVGKKFAKKGFPVKLADLRDVLDTQGQYANALEIPGDTPPAKA